MMMQIANELLRIVDAASINLNGFSETQAAFKPASGKWSKKQLVGHLIDSAVNNHHRFVRAQEVREFTFPKYEQEHWVNVQDYNASSWSELIELWRLYNRHLAQVIGRIPEDKLEVICRIGHYEPVTLGFIVEDYLAHTKHHLVQLEVL
jgi:hypothetical protein